LSFSAVNHILTSIGTGSARIAMHTGFAVWIKTARGSHDPMARYGLTSLGRLSRRPIPA